MLRRMGVGKGAVTDGPMPMLMKKDDLLNLPEDECIIVTFRMPAIKDKKICTKKQIDYLVLTAMSWLAAVSLSGTDRLIVGIFLFPSLPLIPFAGHLWIPVVKKIQGKGEKIESSGYRFLWYLSVFLTNLVLTTG